jgi:hypothetical protein
MPLSESGESAPKVIKNDTAGLLPRLTERVVDEEIPKPNDAKEERHHRIYFEPNQVASEILDGQSEYKHNQ